MERENAQETPACGAACKKKKDPEYVSVSWFMCPKRTHKVACEREKAVELRLTPYALRLSRCGL